MCRHLLHEIIIITLSAQVVRQQIQQSATGLGGLQANPMLDIVDVEHVVNSDEHDLLMLQCRPFYIGVRLLQTLWNHLLRFGANDLDEVDGFTEAVVDMTAVQFYIVGMQKDRPNILGRVGNSKGGKTELVNFPSCCVD